MKISLLVVLAVLSLTSAASAAAPLIFGSIGCKDRDVLARALQLADESDLVAAREAIRRGFKSGDCRILRTDALVYETMPVLSRIIKVHVWGNPDLYWVVH